MDLSQQELPLTAYFTRGTKETRSRAAPHKKDEPTSDPQSAPRSSKRRRSNPQCSTASPLSNSAGRSGPRLTALQLPTPAASARKRMRGGHLEELPGKTQLTSTGVLLSSAEQNSTLSSERDLTQPEFGSTPSKLTQSRKGAGDAVHESPLTPITMPSTDRRKTTKFIDIEFPPGPRLCNHTETGIATPRISSKVVKPVHGIGNHSPLVRSNCHLRSKSSQVSSVLPDSSVSHAALPHVQFLAHSPTGFPHPPVDLGCSDPFHAREKNSVFVPRDGADAQPKQYCIQSKTLDGRPSDDRVMPMIPIPSSQSQYLLHPDATPKRKRCSRDTKHVISSQTQEERELTLSMSHKSAAMVVSPGKHTLCGNSQIPRFSCSERKSQHPYRLGSTPVKSPVNSSAGLSRSAAANKASDELSPECLSPFRGKRLTPCHSPSLKTRTPRRSARQDPIETIPPVHIEESLTESESDSDIIQVPRHSPAPRDACPPVQCGFAQGSLHEDDSATEAESDTEILHCVSEIGKQQPREHCSRISREDTPPVISPLVSPTRPRVAAVPSNIGFTQFSGAGPDVPGSHASYPSTTEQSQIRSESLPSVVRDFIRMFPGDESYPADFPESLRI